ncbi:MAG: multidrug resistance protein [Cohnella sp.]|jgi:predicted MFS family arabinose efflux permease|nr:multidrug resistance protein [Cohnella sp.]
MQGFFTNMGVFYHQLYSLSQDRIGIAFAIAGIGAVLGSIYGGRISDRFGKQKLIVLACILSAFVVIALSTLTGNLAISLLLQTMWAISTGIGQSSLTAFISELNPQIRGTILSFNSSATYLGITLSTAAASAILPRGGFATVGILCGIIYFFVIPIVLYLPHERKIQKGAVLSHTPHQK